MQQYIVKDTFLIGNILQFKNVKDNIIIDKNNLLSDPSILILFGANPVIDIPKTMLQYLFLQLQGKSNRNIKLCKYM